MKVGSKNYTSIWVKENNNRIIQVIDQRFLPHKFDILNIENFNDALFTINDMVIRGAPAIGVMAGYAIYFAVIESEKSKDFENSFSGLVKKITGSRPTAVDLFKAVERQLRTINGLQNTEDKILSAFETANQIREETIEKCRKIGLTGLPVIEEISRKKGNVPVNILTHCNAGWLATVDYGTALAPVYLAFDKGINIHVWVDETRPRNQGSNLTAWELLNHGIPHKIITDNAGGHLMQHGMVDLVIVGTDRTTKNGDVANKTGTYLKALAARDNNIPFYVAAPSNSIDFSISDGLKEIIIEERGEDEVKYIKGLHKGKIKKVLITPEMSPAANYGFDVTPARLITGIITEKGICDANSDSILELFPEYK